MKDAWLRGGYQNHKIVHKHTHTQCVYISHAPWHIRRVYLHSFVFVFINCFCFSFFFYFFGSFKKNPALCVLCCARLHPPQARIQFVCRSINTRVATETLDMAPATARAQCTKNATSIDDIYIHLLCVVWMLFMFSVHRPATYIHRQITHNNHTRVASARIVWCVMIAIHQCTQTDYMYVKQCL